MEVVKNYLSLIKVNNKIWLRKNLVLAIILMIFTPIVFYIKTIDSKAAATILDVYLPLVGIVMIGSIFSPEEKGNVLETVRCRTIDYSFIYLLRMLLGILSTFCIIAFGVFILQMLGGDFPWGKFLYGSFVTALYLGSVAVLVSSITNESIVGYLAGIGYVIMEIATRGEYTKKLYIHSMTTNSFEEKKNVLALGIIFLVASIIINKIRQNK